jgi:hypothetical protein
MSDDFDRLIAGAAPGYNAPGQMDREAMWDRIARERARHVAPARRFTSGAMPRAIAAGILVAAGIGIGRFTAPAGQQPDSPPASAAAAAQPPVSTGATIGSSATSPDGSGATGATPPIASQSDVRPTAARPAARRIPAAVIQSHLLSTADLITSFRATAATGAVDQQLVDRSAALLAATRRLEDVAADSSLRKLLVDLDLVLVQIVQYAARADTDQREVELIEDAIRRRGIMAELQTRAKPRFSPNDMEAGL